MPEAASEPTEPQQQPEGNTEAPKPAQTLEDLLADIDEDRRKVILEQVAKPRKEAQNLRERVKSLEPKARQFEALEEASKSDLERVQADLSAANERTAQAFARAARAEVKAALAGIVDDPDSIVDDLNLKKFVDPVNGDVDGDAVNALKARYSALNKNPRSPRPDSSQGSSGNSPANPSPDQEWLGFLNRALTRG